MLCASCAYVKQATASFLSRSSAKMAAPPKEESPGPEDLHTIDLF